MSELRIKNKSERDLRSCEVTVVTNKVTLILYTQFTHMIFIIYTLQQYTTMHCEGIFQFCGSVSE